MNQIKEWNGFCHRCEKQSNFHIMSMFDVSLICETCLELERKHPDYPKARDTELEEVKRGNRNFKGIGYPHTELGNDPADW